MILNFFIDISPKFDREGPVGNRSALVQVLTWHRSGDKALSKPISTRIYDSIKRNQATSFKLFSFKHSGQSTRKCTIKGNFLSCMIKTTNVELPRWKWEEIIRFLQLRLVLRVLCQCFRNTISLWYGMS